MKQKGGADFFFGCLGRRVKFNWLFGLTWSFFFWYLYHTTKSVLDDIIRVTTILMVRLRKLFEGESLYLLPPLFVSFTVKEARLVQQTYQFRLFLYLEYHREQSLSSLVSAESFSSPRTPSLCLFHDSVLHRFLIRLPSGSFTGQ